jgi:hypothetical protein
MKIPVLELTYNWSLEDSQALGPQSEILSRKSKAGTIHMRRGSLSRHILAQLPKLCTHKRAKLFGLKSGQSWIE